MDEQGESRYWLVVLVDQYCMRCFEYYKYNFWRSLLPHNMLARSPILTCRPPEKCASDSSREGMCAINAHPVSTALVRIAPYRFLIFAETPEGMQTLLDVVQEFTTWCGMEINVFLARN